ncbi:hypothetical protein Salat_0203400, partial [Sesamum alatum]
SLLHVFLMGPLVTGLSLDSRVSRVHKWGNDLDLLLSNLKWMQFLMHFHLMLTKMTRFNEQAPVIPSPLPLPCNYLCHQRRRWNGLVSQIIIHPLACTTKESPHADKLWLHFLVTTCVLCDENVLKSHTHLFFEFTFSWRCLTILRKEVHVALSSRGFGVAWASQLLQG